MDLRQRLERLGVHKGVRHLVVPPVQPQRRRCIEHFVPGSVVETEYGCFYRATERHELTHQQWNWPLMTLLERSSTHITSLARDDSLAGLDFRRAVFLDTETTGLAGGTGTYAFLVGVGYLVEDGFQLDQFFMRDYDEELAMLDELGRFLPGFSLLVSFNGRAFDWPLLETRFAMARRPAPLRGIPHLDLLHVARRLWRARLASCSLSSLEQHILGVRRTGEDVPGWLVPQIYFDYLRSGDAGPLLQVFYHNAQDILSLVALATYLAQIGDDPFHGSLCHGADFYSLARLLESAGDSEVAASAYEHALRSPMSPEMRRAVIMRLATLRKRTGQHAAAVELWQTLLGQGDIVPYVEIAKYHEHVSHDYAAAEMAVREAIAMMQRTPTLSPQSRVQLGELQHRLERVRQKKEKRGVG